MTITLTKEPVGLEEFIPDSPENQEWIDGNLVERHSKIQSRISRLWGNYLRESLVSLFIRALDLGLLKPLCSKARFFVFDPARKIRDTNLNFL